MGGTRFLAVAAVAAGTGFTGPTAQAAEAGSSSLAEAAQNPIAAMISVPFQNNTFFRLGPDKDTANVLNIQPVVPFSVGREWNVITRTIVPLVYVPTLTNSLPEAPASVDSGANFGLGDINVSAFLSPVSKGRVTWGVGPSLGFPSATSKRLGSAQWTAGPTGVALITAKPWVTGALVRQLWSYAGDDDRSDVSQLLIQPFINYNLPQGWYLVAAPIITANWQAGAGDTWLVPVGGGFGRVFSVAGQPINAGLQAYYNATRPSFGPSWSLRAQLTFLFPK